MSLIVIDNGFWWRTYSWQSFCTCPATYVDPLMQGKGHDQIGALITAVHERFPGFRFSLDGRVDGYSDKIRFPGRSAPKAKPT